LQLNQQLPLHYDTNGDHPMSTSEKKTLAIPPPAPIEYAGQWVAWNKARTQIVAHGAQFGEVRRSAIEKGYLDAIFQRVRYPHIAFIGGA
jgi:hypothetical protein